MSYTINEVYVQHTGVWLPVAQPGHAGLTCSIFHQQKFSLKQYTHTPTNLCSTLIFAAFIPVFTQYLASSYAYGDCTTLLTLCTLGVHFNEILVF